MLTQTRNAARKLRNEISSIETYWNNSGAALAKIEEILQAHGLELSTQRFGKEVESGSFRYTYQLIDSESEEIIEDAVLIFLTYKMPETGRIEVTVYIS